MVGEVLKLVTCVQILFLNNKSIVNFCRLGWVHGGWGGGGGGGSEGNN